MSTANKVGATSESTIARIAGNLLSGYHFDDYTSDDTLRHVAMAVAIARAIVAEIERTRPSGDR